MKHLTDFFFKTINKIKTNTKLQNIKLILVIFQFLSTLALILTVFIIQNNAHNNILKQKKNNSNYYIFYDLSIQQNHNSSNNENAAGGYMIRNGFQLKDIIETTCTYLKYNDFKNIDSFLTDDSIYYNARLQFGFTFIILIVADVIKLHLLLKSISQSNTQVVTTTRIDNNEVIENLTDSSNNGQVEERAETKKESKIQTYFQNHEYIKNGYYFLIQLIKLIFAPGIMFYVFIDFESACVKLGAPLNLINLNRVFIIINYIILFSIVLVFVYGIWLAKNDEENHYSFVFGVSCLTVLTLCFIYLTYCFTLFICIFIWGSKISKLMEIMLALSIFIDRVIINLDFFPKAADFIRDFLK